MAEKNKSVIPSGKVVYNSSIVRSIIELAIPKVEGVVNNFQPGNSSKNYIKLQKKRKEIYRKIVAKRKIAENILANKLLSQGNVFNVEKNNFAALAKKSKETTINKKTI